jgi:ubiquinone/menaquinone biosynthesis C-methylase UbiE
MKKTALILLLGCLVAIQPITAQSDHGHGDDATVSHSFESAEDWARHFDAPDRREWQKPEAVLRMLAIEDGQTLADLGCGTGYFTVLLSALVGPAGKVYAVDIEQAMLDHVMSREDLPALDNVVPVLAEPADPLLPENEIDLILTVNTWHHINGRIKYLKKLQRALKPHGRLVIVDWREGDLPMGPPAGHKLDRDKVIKELAKAGWELTTEGTALAYQYVLIFRSPD